MPRLEGRPVPPPPVLTSPEKLLVDTFMGFQYHGDTRVKCVCCGVVFGVEDYVWDESTERSEAGSYVVLETDINEPFGAACPGCTAKILRRR
jgi:hypothetical protein